MIDRSLRTTFRNFSTLFFIVVFVVFPLQLGYGLVFRNVIAVQELHPQIRDFPDDRMVRGVGRAQLTQAQLTAGALLLVELALLPLMVKAARRAIEHEEAGGVPTASGAWKLAFRHAEPCRWAEGGPAVAGAGLAIAAAIFLLLQATGGLLTQLVPGGVRFAAVVLTDTVSRSAALPFFLAPLAVARIPKGGRRRMASP